ncbi:MAG: ComEC family competence protein [Alphaproteobacteria bacterium]|nr:ComEC family competence protein [Alphaproteobacteria bacterium]
MSEVGDQARRGKADRASGFIVAPDESTTDAFDEAGGARTAGGAKAPLAAFRTSVHLAVDEEARFGHGFLWMPVAMVLGAAIWFATDHDIAIWPLALLIAPLAAGVFLLTAYPTSRYCAALACAILIGMVAAAMETRRHATTLLDSAVTTRIQGMVIARDVDDRGRWRYTINLTATDDPIIRRPPERVRLLARSRHEPIGIGEGITGLARLQPPSGPALPGQYDFAFNAYFQGLGAFGFFYGRPETLLNDEAAESVGIATGFKMALVRFRETIALRIRTVLDGDVGAFASALAVADRRAMSPASVEALRASGLAHVLAISGLHMALVAGTVFFALRTGFSLVPSFAQKFPVKKLAAAVSLLVATAYLMISGASVSTQRAWLMLAIVLIAVLVDRPALTLRNVALAAVCIILLTPSAVVGPGFQMSFAATAALIAAYAIWRRRRSSPTNQATGFGIARFILLFFVGLAMTSLVAGFATAPFATFHFHRVASYGLIANLAAMPIVSLIVMPAGLLSILAMPLGLEYWPLQLMGFGLQGVLEVAYFVEALGGHLVTGRLPALAFVLLSGGFLILVLLRSWLRLAGLPMIALAMGLFFAQPTAGQPDLVVSEDGRLVAIVGETALASNRSRPSKFIFEQWQRALRRSDHMRPNALEVSSDKASVTALDWDSVELGVADEPAFHCLKDMLCIGTTMSGLLVAVVTDLSLLGPACDRADIVITSRSIDMAECRSGAILITGRMLRQTGAVEVRGSTDGDAPRIITAIGKTERPWTVHRSFDWRSRTYEFNRPDWVTR